MYSPYQQQQQQQQQQDLQQGTAAMVWNGNQWVHNVSYQNTQPHPQFPHQQQQHGGFGSTATAATTTPSNHFHTSNINNQYSNSQNQPYFSGQSTIGQHQQQQQLLLRQQPQEKQLKLQNSNLVRQYTDYYHQWTALQEEYTAAALKQQQQQQNHGSNNTYDTSHLQNQADWAKYRADLASRAAHFFHNNPSIVQPPADMELPPTPPPSTLSTPAPPVHSLTTTTTNHHEYHQSSQQTVNQFSASTWQSQQTPVPNQSYSSCGSTRSTAHSLSATTNTDGMKRYVDRCLRHFGNSEERKATVMKQVQAMLSQEIQNGTLHTVNWDTKALVSMPSLVPPPAETKNATIQSTPRVIATGWAAARTTPLLTTTSGNDREPIASPQFSASTCAMSNSGAKNSGTSSSGDGGGYHNSAYNNNTGTRHSRVRRGSSSKDDESGNYYGPSAGNDEIEAQAFAKNTNKDSYDTVVDSSSHHGLRDQSKKHFNNKRKDRSVDSTSNDSYYGPSQPNTLSFDGNCLDEFVPVPSYNKSIVNKKSKKNGHAGFNQTNAVLSNRANRFSGKGGVSDVAALTTEYSSKSEQGEWDRYMGKKTIGGTNKKLDEADYENMTIRGTCQTLEKSYLRLTAPPRAELVRPQAVLDQHLQNLRREWEKKSHYYLWFCSQLKAVRQDCTVQRIQNAFAVDVYEMHAKIALEEDDLNEYNQCQTQLKELYAFISKQENDDESSRTALRNSNEFLAYRLVYFVFLAMESQKYDSGSSDMFKVMLSLSHQQHQDPLIKHALAVREACCSGILDYHAFFRLHRECASGSSNVSKSQLIYLLDRIVPAMRYNALLVMCKGYKPSTVEVNFLLKELGFDTGSKSKKEDGRTWLISCGCVLSDDGMELQTKDTVVHESVGELKQSLI